MDEQIQCRVLRALPVTEAPENTPPPVADLDCSDMNVLTVAKDLIKIWVAIIGKKKKPCPWLTALGATLMSMHGDKKKARDSNIMNRDDTEMEDEAGKGQEGEDKGLEGKVDERLKGNGQQDGNEDIGFDTHADDDGYGESEYSIGREGENGTGKGHGGKEKVAAALAANLFLEDRQ